MNANGSTAVRPEKLRRIALQRQGLTVRAPFGRGRDAHERAIRRLGYLQIDTISVVARAHHHTLWNRVPDFDPRHVERLLANRRIFESRFPVAAFRPIDDYRFTLLHARAYRARPQTADTQAMMRHVLERIRLEGPLRARDFDDPAHEHGGWWNWKPAKRALELLYYHGDLMISARQGFEKHYDLTERVLPSGVDVREPTLAEFAVHLVDSTLRAHGFASYRSFSSEARHGVALGNALRSELRRRTREGRLVTFVNDRGTRFWTAPGTLESALPRVPARVRILTPFDNLVTQRERLGDVFGVDYQVECFVPEAKRRYGYFSLPVLYGDAFAARMDCKSHRSESRFEIRALYVEPAFSRGEPLARLSTALAEAVTGYARFENCAAVVITHAEPRPAQRMLQQALRQYAGRA